MAQAIDEDKVREVAALARLSLSADEVAAMTTQLSRVLEYVAVLEELDTTDVEPMIHAVDVANVFRSDEVQTSISRDQALKNAPATDGRYFLVPDILDKSQE